MPLEQLLAVALDPSPVSQANDGRDTGGDDHLSPREREVALLVARGLTNPQIANELVIGERTVQTHVSHILAKLGLSSRVQVASWIAEQRAVRESRQDQ
jgi:non-specific serine/threonine protein kinase